MKQFVNNIVLGVLVVACGQSVSGTNPPKTSTWGPTSWKPVTLLAIGGSLAFSLFALRFFACIKSYWWTSAASGKISKKSESERQVPVAKITPSSSQHSEFQKKLATITGNIAQNLNAGRLDDYKYGQSKKELETLVSGAFTQAKTDEARRLVIQALADEWRHFAKLTDLNTETFNKYIILVKKTHRIGPFRIPSSFITAFDWEKLDEKDPILKDLLYLLGHFFLVQGADKHICEMSGYHATLEKNSPEEFRRFLLAYLDRKKQLTKYVIEHCPKAALDDINKQFKQSEALDFLSDFLEQGFNLKILTDESLQEAAHPTYLKLCLKECNQAAKKANGLTRKIKEQDSGGFFLFRNPDEEQSMMSAYSPLCEAIVKELIKKPTTSPTELASALPWNSANSIKNDYKIHIMPSAEEFYDLVHDLCCFFSVPENASILYYGFKVSSHRIVPGKYSMRGYEGYVPLIVLYASPNKKIAENLLSRLHDFFIKKGYQGCGIAPKYNIPFEDKNGIKSQLLYYTMGDRNDKEKLAPEILGKAYGKETNFALHQKDLVKAVLGNDGEGVDLQLHYQEPKKQGALN